MRYYFFTNIDLNLHFRTVLYGFTGFSGFPGPLGVPWAPWGSVLRRFRELFRVFRVFFRVKVSWRGLEKVPREFIFGAFVKLEKVGEG